MACFARSKEPRENDDACQGTTFYNMIAPKKVKDKKHAVGQFGKAKKGAATVKLTLLRDDEFGNGDRAKKAVYAAHPELRPLPDDLPNWKTLTVPLLQGGDAGGAAAVVRCEQQRVTSRGSPAQPHIYTIPLSRPSGPRLALFLAPRRGTWRDC